MMKWRKSERTSAAKLFPTFLKQEKADGKRKVVEKGGFATRKLAYDAGVAAYNDRRHRNTGIVSENITLKDFSKQKNKISCKL